MKSLSRLIREDRIVWLERETKEECLRELVEALVDTAEQEDFPSTDEIFDAILERERLLSTGFGHGLAIPHAKLLGIQDFAIALGIRDKGLAYESIDDRPVNILVMILCPSAQQEEYLQVLSRVTKFLKDKREELIGLGSAAEVYQLTLDY